MIILDHKRGLKGNRLDLKVECPRSPPTATGAHQGLGVARMETGDGPRTAPNYRVRKPLHPTEPGVSSSGILKPMFGVHVMGNLDKAL